MFDKSLQKEIQQFPTFAKDFNISSATLYDYQSSMTPYVLEERELRATQMDVFSRLMMDRIIWVAGPVDDRMSTIVQAQLIFLDSLANSGKKDITMHIDSPGGSVKSGLSMVDVMQYISCDVCTINTGMAASMGAVLLGAGAKGKRSSLRFSRTMLHQSSGGAGGNIQDARIAFQEWEKYNKILFDLLADFCDKSYNTILQDCERDNWLSAEEAKSYGIIDEVILPGKLKKEGKKK
jgi:ATP-dependent Clp protease, protease subunit